MKAIRTILENWKVDYYNGKKVRVVEARDGKGSNAYEGYEGTFEASSDMQGGFIVGESSTLVIHRILNVTLKTL